MGILFKLSGDKNNTKCSIRGIQYFMIRHNLCHLGWILLAQTSLHLKLTFPCLGTHMHLITPDYINVFTVMIAINLYAQIWLQ